MVRILSCLLVLAFLASPAWAGEVHELMMDRDDVFHVAETDQWRVRVERYLPIRFANVRIDDKQGYPFSLMLYFKCDTPDLADYDSPEKIKRSILISSKKYLEVTVEKEIKLLKVPVQGTYGFYTVLTDGRLVNRVDLKPGEFKYITRGMVRLSKNSALGFSLMTNDLDSADYKKLLDYVYSFVKLGPKS
jgi:hypothetical protein